MSKDHQVVALVILSYSYHKSHAVKGLLLFFFLVISLCVSHTDKLVFLLHNLLMNPIVVSEV